MSEHGEALGVLVLLAAASACVSDPELGGGALGHDCDGGQLAEPWALVVTSDFQTGSYSRINVRTREAANLIEVVHQDAVCRWSPELELFFIVRRLGSDAIDAVDPCRSWSVVEEYSVGPGTNPQDIAVVDADRAFVCRYQDAELLVVDPLGGAVLQRIDLSAYADADGIPECAWLLRHGDRVYAALQRLDADRRYLPTEHSLVLALDAATGEVLEAATLTGTNPFAPLRHSSVCDGVVVVEAGGFGALDGGIECLTPGAAAPGGFLVTEAALGGDLVDAALVSETLGYAIVGVGGDDAGSADTHLVSFDPATGEKIADLAARDGYTLTSLELTPDGRELWVSDRRRTAPGIRVYDTASGAELTAAPLDTHLPPFMICFGGPGGPG